MTKIVKRHGVFKNRPRLRGAYMLVLHHTAGGTLSGAVSTLKKRGLGYHYLVDKDGTIYEYVPPHRRCSHAYRANTGTVGASFVGGGRFGECNDKQLEAFIFLGRFLKQKHGLTHVSGHKHVDSRGWKIDPRFAGEPANGVNWNADAAMMQHIASETGLKFLSRKHIFKKKAFSGAEKYYVEDIDDK